MDKPLDELARDGEGEHKPDQKERHVVLQRAPQSVSCGGQNPAARGVSQTLNGLLDGVTGHAITPLRPTTGTRPTHKRV